jgi:hypothetical protein
MDGDKVYRTGYLITAVIVFIGCWIYCIGTYGYLVGLGVGWLPSMIVALIVSVFWPLIVLGVVGAIFTVLR